MSEAARSLRRSARAHRVAADVMQSLPDPADWSDWHVSVHDLSVRRVLVQPFVPACHRLSAAA